MGSVRVDLNKRERIYEQELKLNTPDGVMSYLEKLHFFREQRFNGDIDASIMYLDVMDAIKEIRPFLSEREYEVIDNLYFKGMTAKETGKKLGISPKAVNQYTRRAVHKIADTIAYMGGYDNVALQ